MSAPRARDARDGADVVLEAVQVVRVTRGYHARAFVDPGIVLAGVDRPVVRQRCPVHLRAPRVLGEPHVPDGRELRGAGEHAASRAVEAQRARERARGLRHRARDRNLVDVRVDQSCERLPRPLYFGDPRIPVHSVAAPRLEVRVGGRARGVRLRRLRAIVHRDCVRQQRNARTPLCQVVSGCRGAHGWDVTAGSYSDRGMSRKRADARGFHAVGAAQRASPDAETEGRCPLGHLGTCQ